MRICSFLPSATEIIYTLGLGDQLYGVTRSCDYPAEALTKPIVVRSILDEEGLTSGDIDRIVKEHARNGQSVYHIDMAALRAAAPDLILTQQLCDVCAVGYDDVLTQVKDLPKKPRVVSLNPTSLGDVLQDILTVGEVTDTSDHAKAVVSALQRRIDAVRQQAAKASMRPRVFCLEWMDPLFVSGHWMPEMVEIAGGTDGVGNHGTPSTRITWESVRDYQPEVVILMPCGADVAKTLSELSYVQALPGWADLPAVRDGRLYAVDAGAYFSRSGPRLVDGLELLAQIIQPELFPWTVPAEIAVRVEGPKISQQVSA
ncbi:MAG TPA: cobalamin-binding protein [Candidatus Tectomicrobia bacterium]|jgi:iron complex transport system substrate-binding protein|nr:cobalamin-binding protein [Candidatus Tectomicrobia bacterium]